MSAKEPKAEPAELVKRLMRESEEKRLAAAKGAPAKKIVIVVEWECKRCYERFMDSEPGTYCTRCANALKELEPIVHRPHPEPFVPRRESPPPNIAPAPANIPSEAPNAPKKETQMPPACTPDAAAEAEEDHDTRYARLAKEPLRCAPCGKEGQPLGSAPFVEEPIAKKGQEFYGFPAESDICEICQLKHLYAKRAKQILKTPAAGTVTAKVVELTLMGKNGSEIAAECAISLGHVHATQHAARKRGYLMPVVSKLSRDELKAQVMAMVRGKDVPGTPDLGAFDRGVRVRRAPPGRDDGSGERGRPDHDGRERRDLQGTIDKAIEKAKADGIPVEPIGRALVEGRALANEVERLKKLPAEMVPGPVVRLRREDPRLPGLLNDAEALLKAIRTSKGRDRLGHGLTLSFYADQIAHLLMAEAKAQA